MKLFTPSKKEAGELLLGPGEFRGLVVCAEALPPAFFWERAMAAEGADWIMPRLFVDEVAGRVVGAGGFKYAPKEGRVEIGYGVSSACRGNGYATQGVLWLCEEAFSSGLVAEVLAETSPFNLASQRVLEKAGFTWYGSGTDDQGPVHLWIRKSPKGRVYLQGKS